MKKKEFEIRGRLKLIGDKVRPCTTVCDIGTDHAYIPIYLIGKGICINAIATDINKGPIKIAKENIESYGMENLIETRLGYGLEPIQKNEAEVIIIAGMGGRLIVEILSSGFTKAIGADYLILQPMNCIDIVRKYIWENGFEIFDEELAAEGNKIYNVICAKYTGTMQEFKDEDCIVGEKLIEKADPLLKRYAEKKIKQIKIALDEIEKSKHLKNNAHELLKHKKAFIKAINFKEDGDSH